MQCNLRNFMLVTALAASCGFTQAQAATLTDDFTVMATVNASCSMVAGDISFGYWDPLSGDAQSTGTISVTCSSGLPYAVAINLGSWSPNFNCAVPTRQMFDNGARIDYGLYHDAGLGQPWGCDVSNDQDGIGVGSNQLLIVYASIPATQSITSGAYSDNLMATITF